MTLDALIHRPRFVPSETGGFNGQAQRKRLFCSLMALPFDVVVETGTCMGSTTGYMSLHARVPIHSCETSRLFYFAAKRRLAGCENVTIYRKDSRKFLRDLARQTVGQAAFFYLDAHWWPDLPLTEELEIIARGWPDCVVMIDDFAVAGDDGYRFDDYGPGHALVFDLIRDVVVTRGLVPFAPSARSEDETGHRRGCIVLASESWSRRVADLKTLRPWDDGCDRESLGGRAMHDS